MNCPECGKDVQRPHHHGDEGHTVALRYGRLKAEMEHDWMRELVARTHADLDREIASENMAIRNLKGKTRD